MKHNTITTLYDISYKCRSASPNLQVLIPALKSPLFVYIPYGQAVYIIYKYSTFKFQQIVC